MGILKPLAFFTSIAFYFVSFKLGIMVSLVGGTLCWALAARKRVDRRLAFAFGAVAWGYALVWLAFQKEK
jgi:hypothetical protein